MPLDSSLGVVVFAGVETSAEEASLSEEISCEDKIFSETEGGNSVFSNAGLFPSTTPKTAKITQTHSATTAAFDFIESPFTKERSIRSETHSLS